jgi:uroporphyrin-III C-methyltransferase/precorrin-2 dehydrogenase/sirohydrochlorin ferrochelatase
MSVAGRKALMEADVVVADRLAPRELLGELPADVELIDVAKLPRGRCAQQAEINRVIVERALAGKRVVRFKGGDNFVFGRGYEEVIACREAGVPVTVIPGLTSPVAVPAIAGIPVTHRGVTHEFTIVSGHLPPGHAESLVDYDALARMRGTIVVMMGVENSPEIAKALLTGGREAGTPVAIVCDGTMPTQRTVLATLSTLGETVATERVQPPAIIVVGEVVRVAFPDAFPEPSTPADG